MRIVKRIANSLTWERRHLCLHERVSANCLSVLAHALRARMPALPGQRLRYLQLKIAVKHAILTVSALLLLSGAVGFAQDNDNSIIVEVKTDGGEALARACVTLVPKKGELIFRKADSKGLVVVKKLTPGSYRVVVKVDGYEAQKREVAVGSGNETVAFLMQPREKR